MPYKPCPNGQTRNRVTRLCRDKKTRRGAKMITKMTNSYHTKEHMDVLPAAVISVYKIPEIPKKGFVRAIKPIYDILEKKINSVGDDDLFLKSILSSHAGITDIQWEDLENVRRNQKRIEMKMGDFHEEIFGLLPGYRTLPVGHETGCDVMSDDGTIVIEVKNRHNTLNSDSAKSVINKLKDQVEKGREAILVFVNCPKKAPRFKAPASIKVLTGREAYGRFSGRDTFFDDLNTTLNWCFATFKKYSDLESAINTH
jgi:hypothetical protein